MKYSLIKKNAGLAPELQDAESYSENVSGINTDAAYTQMLPTLKELSESTLRVPEPNLVAIARDSFAKASFNFLPKLRELKSKLLQKKESLDKTIDRRANRLAVLPPGAKPSGIFFFLWAILILLFAIEGLFWVAEIVNAIGYIEDSGVLTGYAELSAFEKFASVLSLIGAAICTHLLYCIASPLSRKYILGASVICFIGLLAICIVSYGLTFAPATHEDSADLAASLLEDPVGDEEESESGANGWAISYIVTLLALPIFAGPLFAAATKGIWNKLQASFPNHASQGLEDDIESLRNKRHEIAAAIEKIQTTENQFEEIRDGYVQRVLMKYNSLHEAFVA